MDYRRYQCFEITRQERILTVAFNRPEALNAINAETHTELSRLFADIAQDQETNVVVLTGKGRAFSAGGDIKWFQQMTGEQLDALFVEGLGIKADIGGHLARTGFRIDGDYHPKGPTQLTHLFPTSPGINPLNFGYLYPNAPVDHPYYIAVPKLPQPYLIWNEIGYPLIRDDGLGVVAANAVVMALTGIRIEMRGG